MTRLIYLDAAASTPIDPLVLDTMLPVLGEVYGNPGSSHWAGQRARNLVEGARESVGALAHQGPSSVVFLSGATEANALALHGMLASAEEGRRSVVSCVTEHPAVLEPLRALADSGVPVHLVSVDSHGRPDLDQLASLVDDTTFLVTIMAANNETGVMVDLSEVAAIAHSAGAFFHTDASQLLTWGPLPANHEADLVTVSGHKMHGPKGVGALIVGREARHLLQPIQRGGGQERGLRGGTTNVAGVVGLGAAADRAMAIGATAADTTAALRDQLERGLLDALPAAVLNGARDVRLPGVLNIAVGDVGYGVEGDAVLARLPRVAASTGSACSSGVPGPSQVLLAMGMPVERAQSSLRFSLSRLSVRADVEDALPMVIEAVRAVREATSASPDEGLVFSQ